MLLRLVPEPPHPTILFTLAFNNLPEGLPFPPAWTVQLQQILHDELEMPQCIHALDKASWAACLLHEVTFSVAARRVSAMFIDGTSFEWPLENDNLSSSLKEVMDDVSESSVAAEMEQRRAQAIQAAAQAQAAQERMPATPTMPAPAKGKHKKSRSLLMSLVASFCPSTQSAPAPVPLVPPRSIAPLELAPPPPEPPQSSRFLRRKARAGLVDIYRRYILPALAVEAPYLFNQSGFEGGFNGGGYILWNLQSILKRIDCRMQELSAEMGLNHPSRSSSVKSANSRSKHRRTRAALPMPSEAPLDEEEPRDSEGSAESADTEASSASLQTPSDVLPAYPIMCTPEQEEENARVRREGGIVRSVTHLASLSPSPAQQCHPLPRARPQSRRPTKRQPLPAQNRVNSAQYIADQHEYAILHASTVRLGALINRTAQLAQTQADERNAALVQLERRSRRRAWSCRQLLGGAYMDVGTKEGLAAPLRSSGLRRSWTVAGINGSRSIEKIQLHARLQGLGRPSGPQISSRGQDDLPPPRFYVPSQANCVPFPQTSPVAGEGDDFCSTGPQDTSTLFGEGEGEGDDSDSPPASPTGQGLEHVAPFARSSSSDDLPSLFSSLSTPSSTTASSLSSPSTSPSPPSDLGCDFESVAFEDAEMEDMELGHLPVPPELQSIRFGDEPPVCDEFRGAGTLRFEKPALTAPIPVPAGKSKFGDEMNRIGTAIGRGMGARLYARRRTTLLR